MHLFKQDEIVILLGAGASVDAGIPHSSSMIKKTEELLNEDNEVKLYNYIKSSIYFSDGINGNFDHSKNFNIERLVNTLVEISKKNDHTLYPFVGAWNPTLLEIAGDNFCEVSKLRSKIVKTLRKKWIVLSNNDNASYFSKIEDFQKDYNYPLRVFTLNYDLCIEKNISDEIIERGFNESRIWDWKKFNDENESKPIYLYKLHGSTDWIQKDAGLTYVDDPGLIDDDDAEIIFGTSYKLQYRDPFLFFAYEFRKWTLESRIIICIGYGFGDDHINKILSQALLQNKDRLLISVSPCEDTNEKKDEISKLTELDSNDQIKIESMKAKEYFNKKFNLSTIASFLPDDGLPFIEIQ